MSKTCSVEGCNNKHLAKGYCDKHYKQIKKYGRILERTRFDPNEIIEYDDYAEIALYNQDCKEVARTIIDLDDVDKVKQYKWTYKGDGYVICKKMNILLHRFIMNPPDDMVVDHENRNPLDNRKDNLRVCTQHENIFNTSMKSNNISGTVGVSWHNKSNKWRAYISINGKQKHLGLYDSIEEAIAARRQAEIDYFGEYSPNNNQE